METVFLTEFAKEYSELIETGKIQIVEDVKKLTSKHFFYDYPLYFSGNIRSKIALVTFNAHKEYLKDANKPEDFIAYQQKHQSLGKIFLDPAVSNGEDPNYPEDIRVLNYIKPFQVFRFDSSSLQKNLQKLTDEKLELGLVPYLSPDFSSKDFMSNYSVCRPFIERILKGILAYPRQYVVFVGDCFEKVLSEYIVESERFSFLLTSQNIPNQKFVARFTRITLTFNERKIIAGIAESFFDDDFDEIMIEKYGRESVAILNRGLLLANPLWKSQ